MRIERIALENADGEISVNDCVIPTSRPCKPPLAAMRWRSSRTRWASHTTDTD
jgi:hypothetical protein